MIKVSEPCIRHEEMDAVMRVLESGNLAAGEEVAAFEREFANYVGKKHAIATSSGTTAQFTGVNVLRDDREEIIVPAFTFFSAAATAKTTYTKLKFVDVDSKFPTVNYDLIEKAISNDTGLISPTNLYGAQCKDLERIYELCQNCNIPLLLDSCQATAPWGAEHSDIAVFSFYPTKNMTTGEGGMIVTDDFRLAERCRELINHGQRKKYVHTCYGYNFRMTDIAAAIGREQLKKLFRFNNRRREIAHKYIIGFEGWSGIHIPTPPDESMHVYHQFAVTLGANRNITKFRRSLGYSGVETAVHYPKPIHHQPLFMRQTLEKHAKFVNAEHWANRVVSLPCHPNMIDDDVYTVINAVKIALGDE